MGIIPRPPTEAAIGRVVRATFHLPDLLTPPAPVVHIVDGDPRASRLVRRGLEELVPGCRVVIFESPVEALLALAVERPTLLVVDLDLPALTPAELLRAISSHVWEVPLCIVAVSRDQAMDGPAIAAGAHTFAANPYTAEALAAQLQTPGGSAQARGSQP
jgi:FixJ family two-component response regulator